MAYIDWRRGEGVLACRLDRGKIPLGDMAAGVGDGSTGAGRPDGVVVDPDGLHRKGVKWVKDLGGTAPAKEKGVFIEMGSRALFFVNGRYEGELAQGAYRLDRIERSLEKRLHTYHPVVVLLDAGETWIDFEVYKQRTADDEEADLFLQLAIQLTDPELFFANVMKGAESFSVAELRKRLFSALRAGVGQYAAQRNGSDLAQVTDRARNDLLMVLQGSCSDILRAMGFALVRVNVFTSEVALDNVRRRAAAKRKADRQSLAEEREQSDVDAERAALTLDKTRKEYAQRKDQADLDRLIKTGEAEDALAGQKVDDGLAHEGKLQELATLKNKIDVWARFADETLRCKALEQHHVLELRNQLDEMAQDYRKLGKIRDEEWDDFQRDIDWKHKQQQWEDLDRDLEGSEKAEDRTLKAEQARRQRNHILQLLDMRLAKELQQTQLQDADEITRLKLELARRQIEEKLDLDKVDARAGQELAQVLFEGRQAADARDQSSLEQSLTYAQRTAEMKRVLDREALNHEVEVNQLRAEIVLSAVDRKEADNLLAQVTRQGETEDLEHTLDQAAKGYQAARDERLADVTLDLEVDSERARVYREIRFQKAKAEMDAEVYETEARHRLQLLDLDRDKVKIQNDADELALLIGNKHQEKLNKLTILKGLAEIDAQIEKQEHEQRIEIKRLRNDHVIRIKELKFKDREDARAHERALAEGKNKVEEKKLDTEVDVAKAEAGMTADQIEARHGMEEARKADYESRGGKRDAEREREFSDRQRGDLEKQMEQQRQDALDREAATRKDTREREGRDERIISKVTEEVRKAGQGAVAQERNERTGDAGAAREHKDDMREAYREGIDALTGVKRESVTAQRTEVHVTGNVCPHCHKPLATQQPSCANCGGDLSPAKK